MPQLRVKTEHQATRCEICHQSDLFDAENDHCQRCSNLSIEYYRVAASNRRSPITQLFAWQQQLSEGADRHDLEATFSVIGFAIVSGFLLWLSSQNNMTCVSGSTDWSSSVGEMGGGEDFTSWGCGGFFNWADHIDDLFFLYFTTLLLIGALVTLYGWLRTGYYSIIFNNR